MDDVRSRQDAITNIKRHGWLVIAGLAAVAPAPAEAAAREAHVVASRVELVRSIETARLGVPRPTRLGATVTGRRLVVGGRRDSGPVRRPVSLNEKPAGPVAPGAVAARRVRAFGARVTLDVRRQRISKTTSRGRRTLASLRGAAAGPFRALAYNRSDGLVYALGDTSVVGFDAAGRRMHAASLRPLALAAPRALAFAASGDPTDDPAVRHLYVADRGDARREGRVVEATFASSRASLAAVEEVRAPFVKSIRTSAFGPPAPDPAGIVYVPAADRFIVSDSEVDEMTIYQGANLFSAAPGSVQGSGTGTTTAFSKEPSGLGYDPATATLYVSDDDGDRITVDRPGPDGRHGTRDDLFQRFSTAAFGSYDAEGVEFDPATGHLFVCDGVGLEVYEVDPVNGTFGDAGDVVTHFDVAAFGMRDCEGIGLDTRRNLLLAVDPTRRKLYELTKAGGLARIVDFNTIPVANRNLASVTMAPSSNPGDSPSTLSYWVADRQVDNGADPNENDGLVHELTVPGGQPPADAPPTVSVTQPTAGAGVSGAVTVQASATDDSGAVASVRVLVDGVAVGTDANGADGWSVVWDTTRVPNGGHAVTAVATDAAGNTGASAPVQVVVQNAATPRALSVPVRDRSDDASELQDGTVNRTNGDLELGSDLGTPTTTGMRFTGLAIPRGARVTRAWVQFNADELDRRAATLTLRAQAADSPLAFTSSAFDVSSRPRTAASVVWSAPTWTVFGAAGAEQRTPDLAAIVQEVVDRPGWASGNALAVLVTGSGRRTAESFEGGFPPVLNVEFSAP